MKCVIQIHRNSNDGNVLFKYSGTAMMEVCYSHTEEQQLWKCVIQIQRKNNDGSVLFKYRGTTTLEMCYSNTEEQH